MHWKTGCILGFAAAAWIGHGVALADNGCVAAPTVECILDIAHDSAESIKAPAPRAMGLLRIATAEAVIGTTERMEDTLAMVRFIADSPGLAEGMNEDRDSDMYGPRSEDDIRAILQARIMHVRAISGASLAVLAEIIENSPDGEFRLGMTYGAAESLIEAKRFDDARVMIDRLVQAADATGNAEIIQGVRGAAVSLYVQVGDFDTARNIAMAVPDDQEFATKVGHLVEIARAQRKAGDKAGAEATVALAEGSVAAIENAEMRDIAMTMIAQIREEGSGPKAQSPDKVGSCPADLSPYGIAVDKAKFGYFAEALELALALEDPEQRDRALGRISRLQSEAGQPDGGYDTALMVNERFNRGYALGAAAKAYAKAGNADGAWIAAQSITEEFERLSILSDSIAPLVEAGNPAGAATLVGNIADPARRAELYSALAESMVKATLPPAEDGEAAANPG